MKENFLLCFSLLAEIVITTILFALILGVAWLLGLFVHYLETNGLSPHIVWVSILIEYGLFYLDVALYVVTLGKIVHGFVGKIRNGQ